MIRHRAFNGLKRMLSSALFAVMLVGASGCYHTIVDTGLPKGDVHEDGFASAFISGLVPAKIDASAMCGGKRIAAVESQYSFLNILVGLVTIGIFTPMDVKVTCER
ncbi:MAG TPA: Bor family protein [Gemmatimonadales bacterium]